MPTLHVEANLSTEQLLQAMKQMDPRELKSLSDQILALRARQQAPAASAAETDLLLQINAGLPADLLQRYKQLIAKRQDETLSEAEHRELLDLSQEVERRQANRVHSLVALAQLRGVSLDELMQQLGVNGIPNG